MVYKQAWSIKNYRYVLDVSSSEHAKSGLAALYIPVEGIKSPRPEWPSPSPLSPVDV
jgi:hypothetical protein